jgi:hypothetical protein
LKPHLKGSEKYRRRKKTRIDKELKRFRTPIPNSTIDIQSKLKYSFTLINKRNTDQFTRLPLYKMNQPGEAINIEEKGEKKPVDNPQEYAAIRLEILTWISVQYTIIAITASVTVIALSLLRETSHRSWFSCILILIVACLGFLTAYAHSKITLAGAYITVFHSHRTMWDHLVYTKLKYKWTVATMGFFIPMLLFYLTLYSLIVLYSLLTKSKEWSSEEFKILIIPTAIYFLMLFVLWRSGRREPYEKIWKSLQNN